jgi:hypothetical protein
LAKVELNSSFTIHIGFPGTLAVGITALWRFLKPLLSLTLTQLLSSGFEFSFVLLTSFTVWATAWFTHRNYLLIWKIYEYICATKIFCQPCNLPFLRSIWFCASELSGYREKVDNGLMQFGHSKDNPKIPQIKIMTGALDPLGMLLTLTLNEPESLKLFDSVKAF